MIVGLSATPKAAHDSPEETLLHEAGELVWHAGPTAKFPSLCHGAAGSGYALLKLYERTGDPRWLARARAFAMHAIERAERALDSYGQRKYSLWTGDLGLAVFLSACIREDAGSQPSTSSDHARRQVRDARLCECRVRHLEGRAADGGNEVALTHMHALRRYQAATRAPP
jgi:hypothetical protein